MEIIHALYKLKIETTDHSSSQEEEKEEDKRNWLDLPPDVTSLIFLKLGTVDILGSVQWVCSSWWKLCKQPHLFRSIHVENVSTIFGYNRNLDVPNYFMVKLSEGLAREAIDRSCGQLVEFSVRAMSNDVLRYLFENPFRSSSLRSLRLVDVKLVNIVYFCTEIGLDETPVPDFYLVKEMAKKLPHLEELEIIKCLKVPKVNFSDCKVPKVVSPVIEIFGLFCPQLKSFRLNCGSSCFVHRVEFLGVALAIARNMPELRHLNLFGNPMTHDALGIIIDGCPHLESLDLRRCFNFNLGQDLKERCKNIKVLRLPNDPIDDFEYDFVDEYGPYGDNYGNDDYYFRVKIGDGDFGMPYDFDYDWGNVIYHSR